MLSPNEEILAAAWLQRFGAPLPLLGCEELVAQILRDHGVNIPLMDKPKRQAKPNAANVDDASR